MKKMTIVTIVVLVAALAGLKYFASKRQEAAPRPAATAAQPEQGGVALPQGAAESSGISTESVYVPTQSMGSYEMFSLPPAVMSLKGACEGGSFKDIMDNHGKTWGYFTGRRIAFDTRRTHEMYAAIASYYACVAMARQDITVCNELPGEAEREGVKLTLDESPLGLCRTRAGDLLFRAYVAGKAKDRQNCMAYLGLWDTKDQGRVSPPEFCAAAAQGPEKFTEYGRAKMGEFFSIGEKMMAFTKKVCGSDQECLVNNAAWEGIRTGSPDKCPAHLAPHCAALAQKATTPCVDILMDMSRKYCAYHKELMKSGGGYAGVTADEVKEDLRQKALKKAEEDKARKDQEAIMKETNDKVRKLIGKQGGN